MDTMIEFIGNIPWWLWIIASHWQLIALHEIVFQKKSHHKSQLP